jgi:hypothetical protein
VSRRLALLVALAVIAVAGVALAASGGSGNVTLCVAKKGGALKLASNGKCNSKQRKLIINKQGPVGPRGLTGPAGKNGKDGKNGTPASLQPEAVRFVKPGLNGVYCGDDRGRFCTYAPDTWHNYTNPVGFQKDVSGYVHLRGFAKSDFTTPQTPIFYLPASYAPSDYLREFKAGACGGGSTYVDISPDGSVNPGTTCVVLDGIDFHP